MTDELSFGAFISEKRFLIMTSSLAQAAADLTSSSERPFFKRKEYVNDDYKSMQVQGIHQREQEKLHANILKENQVERIWR